MPTDCGELPDPANGMVSHPAGTQINGIAFYECFEGFELNGVGVRFCLTGAVWSDSAPTCDRRSQQGSNASNSYSMLLF